MKDSPAYIQLQSFTKIFDDYFLYQIGVRSTPAPKPVQDLPSDIRTRIIEIDAARKPGFVEEICSILDEWRAELPSD